MPSLKSPLLASSDAFLTRRSKREVIGIGLIGVLLCASIHYFIGHEISFAVFYSIPISMVAWYAGRSAAILVSVASAIAWHESNRLSGLVLSVPAILYWNAITRLGFFLIISLLLASLRDALQREQALSRTDPLTGINNRRAFLESAYAEHIRALRLGHPLVLAYIDLDHFKQINDHSGHAVGDQLLRVVATTLRQSLREIDVLARLGGDEFGLIMVEAREARARAAVERMRDQLLAAMVTHGWPVTFSIGVLVCEELPASADEMVQLADALMYSAKTGGRNRIAYQSYSAHSSPQ